MSRVRLWLKSGAIVSLLLNEEGHDDFTTALQDKKARCFIVEKDGTVHLIDWLSVEHISFKVEDECYQLE